MLTTRCRAFWSDHDPGRASGAVPRPGSKEVAAAPDGNLHVVVGDGEILRSLDGGRSWKGLVGAE
jgi:photosystem II stability/assembly factor-like uncharacterized protein